jgi:hypothetical protein
MRSSTPKTWLALGATSLLWPVTLLLAEEATLAFTVVDATNDKPLPGARVVLVADDPIDEQYAGPAGTGQSKGLAPGQYTIAVSMAGFKSAHQEVHLSVGPNEVSVRLEPFRLVSLIHLLAAPDEYDGLPVAVDGFCSIGFEDDALYLHREDWLYSVTSNALWIEATPPVVDERYDKKRVTIFGVFVSDTRAGLYGGGIRSIDRVAMFKRRR